LGLLQAITAVDDLSIMLEVLFFFAFARWSICLKTGSLKEIFVN
jgi:hypothetical protein